MDLEIRSPRTPDEWQSYYRLRWELLRKPWGVANLKDEDEDTSMHFVAIDRGTGEVFATGRVLPHDEHCAQIRSMAVDPKAQGRGIGRLILAEMERQAAATDARRVILQAREQAVPFYEKCGYRVREKTHILFGEIQHFLMEKNLVTPAPTRPLEFELYPLEDIEARARDFFGLMNRRRSVRSFSTRPVPREIIASCIRTAGTAPSGANKQPWHFAAVSDPALKRRIREGAEEEERRFYSGGASKDWLDDLAHLGTDANKPHLTDAPWLIVIFGRRRGEKDGGGKDRHYYVKESVGIATGMLITALHQAGLATLTHTPSPMDFLNEILERPKTDFPFLILVVGFPADGCRVPDIMRKPLDVIAAFHE